MKIPWRGRAVLAAWVAWPPVFFAGYWLASILLQTGRRCSIEGCNAPGTWLGRAVYLAGMLGPPLYLTVRWYRHRRRTV